MRLPREAELSVPPSHGEAPEGCDHGGGAGEGKPALPLAVLAAVSVIGGGIQFGWALQLSLLTPYVETLGIPHEWASFIWLCGPISGLLVQPCVGAWSDNCTSRFGRRRPFILGGALLVVLAVLLIGFSADLGYHLGDKRYMHHTTRPYACALFILGFWCLDLSNNTVQGPSRALLSDLAGSEQMEQANALYSLWLALGNILGYSTGAVGEWHRWFPWLKGTACGEACANLKAAFLLAIVFLSLCTAITLYFAREEPLILSQQPSPKETEETALLANGAENGTITAIDLHRNSNGHSQQHPEMREIELREFKPQRKGKGEEGEALTAVGDAPPIGVGSGPAGIVSNMLVGVRALPPSMKSVLIVMALSWLAWFPFLLFDTDWMGREIFHGRPSEGEEGEGSIAGSASLYQQGVHEGALGLLLNSIVQAIVSVFIDPLCRFLGAKNVWAIANFVLSVCMALTYTVTASSGRGRGGTVQSPWVKVVALIIFAILGGPLAITMSVPYALTAELTADSGGGQGLAMGILNMAIVVPQIVVSLGSGPWDQLFGGGNVPAFAAAAVFALLGGLVAATSLPSAQKAGYRLPGGGGWGGHGG